jgi:hypothetical protein
LADESTRAQLEIDPAVGTVEMKITARARDEDEVLEALERAHIEPEAREVYFFDTEDLTLFEAESSSAPVAPTTERTTRR